MTKSRKNCQKCTIDNNCRILDKKIVGTLDQSKGCLIIYHEQPKPQLYLNSSLVIENMVEVVEKLNEATKILKKHH